jgi:hypothetical protein
VNPSMDAMSYDITLPADYDMNIIRHRVATRGPGTDDFPGLAVKAYGIREKGVDGSPVNQYALFYLWADSSGLKEFLFGPGFAALSADFGRPPVRHWTGVGFTRGPEHESAPQSATRLSSPLAADVPLPEAISSAVQDLEQFAAIPGVHSAAVVADLASWELMLFTLWAQPAPGGPGDRYQILHASRPCLKDLQSGRQW